jgi:hypothetical protein
MLLDDDTFGQILTNTDANINIIALTVASLIKFYLLFEATDFAHLPQYSFKNCAKMPIRIIWVIWHIGPKCHWVMAHSGKHQEFLAKMLLDDGLIGPK